MARSRQRSAGGINLSSRPFVNSRPVVRTTILLWVAGVLLVALAAWRFYGYYAGRADQRAEIAQIEEAMDGERAEIAELENQFSGLALDNLNSRVAFLNQRIAERTFSWSLLFDRLADILPNDVRLLALTPQFSVRDPRPRRASDAQLPDGRQREVLLNIYGSARSSDALLEFIDALFADPAFGRPNPHQENREGGGDSRFSLTVTYRPDAAAGPSEEAEAADETEAADEAEASAEVASGEVASEADTETPLTGGEV